MSKRDRRRPPTVRQGQAAARHRLLNAGGTPAHHPEPSRGRRAVCDTDSWTEFILRTPTIPLILRFSHDKVAKHFFSNRPQPLKSLTQQIWRKWLTTESPLGGRDEASEPLLWSRGHSPHPLSERRAEARQQAPANSRDPGTFPPEAPDRPAALRGPSTAVAGPVPKPARPGSRPARETPGPMGRGFPFGRSAAGTVVLRTYVPLARAVRNCPSWLTAQDRFRMRSPRDSQPYPYRIPLGGT